MSNVLVITSSSKPKFLYKKRCPECETVFAFSSKEKYCPSCYAKFKPSKKKKVLANTLPLNGNVLFCRDCKSTLYTNQDEKIVSKAFCPVCSSGNLDLKERSDETNLDDKNDEEYIFEPEENIEDSSEVDGLEAKFIDGDERKWFFFRKSKPVFSISEESLEPNSRHIFATSDFVNAFYNRANETSLSVALDEFSADVFDSKAIKVNDVVKANSEKYTSRIIPKILDCSGLVIEGSSKGFYPEVLNPIKESMFDFLKASGIDERRIVDAIESSFSSTGKETIGLILSKAMEFSEKEDNILNELRNTIRLSGKIKNSVDDVYEEANASYRRRIEEGSFPVNLSSGSKNHQSYKLESFRGLFK